MPPKTIEVKIAKKSAPKKSGASFAISKERIKKPVLKPIAKIRTFDEIIRDKTARAKVKRNITQELVKMKKPGIDSRTYSSPYAYIYADYLKGVKFEKIMRGVENRLTDLGISGRIHRLSQFKNLEEIIEEDVKRGVSTVVVVGDDAMVKEAINITADLNVALGIIPVGSGEDSIAALLGVPEGVAACDTLSQRIVDYLDIGKINNKIFLSRLSIFGQRTPIVCDGKYEIFSPGGDIVIYNLDLENKEKLIKKINVKDGRFEVLVKPKETLGMKLGFGKAKSNYSLFFAKEIIMKSTAVFSIYVDGKKNFYKEVEIKILPKKLKVIVGKNRLI
ncbi:MAG: diacylglycerol kinase family protein [Patescibacteria group bacterium]